MLRLGRLLASPAISFATVARNKSLRAVAAYLALRADDFESKGMSPEEARVAAMRSHFETQGVQALRYFAESRTCL